MEYQQVADLISDSLLSLIDNKTSEFKTHKNKRLVFNEEWFGYYKVSTKTATHNLIEKLITLSNVNGSIIEEEQIFELIIQDEKIQICGKLILFDHTGINEQDVLNTFKSNFKHKDFIDDIIINRDNEKLLIIINNELLNKILQLKIK